MEKEDVQKVFGGKVRVRTCGLLIENDSMLLIKHSRIGKNGSVWLPPGGGIEHGESAHQCLKREFLEETGLVIEVCDFLFTYEFMSYPLHALELFFQVKRISGTLKTGTDPELANDNQLIEEVDFISFLQLDMTNKEELHEVFRHCDNAKGIIHQRGFLKFENNT